MVNSLAGRWVSGLAALALASVTAPAFATYWSLFNAEGESSASAVYVTYATLDDMLHDTNRVSFGVPDGVGFGHNIVGSGSDGFASGDGDGNGGNIPEPSTVLLVGVALAGLSFSRRRNLH